MSSLHRRPQLLSRFFLLTLLAFAVMMTGCKKEPDRVTAATSKYEAADSETASTSTSSDTTSKNASDVNELKNQSVADNAASEPSSVLESAETTPPSSTSSAEETTTSTPVGPSQPTTTKNNPPQQPPSIPRDQLDRMTIPDGPPDQIWAFIEELQQRPLIGRTEDERLLDKRNLLNTMILAAEKILQNQQAPTQLRQGSVQIKLAALEQLSSMGVTEASPHMVEFCKVLSQDQDPVLAKIGRLLTFSFEVRELIEGRSKDAKPIIAGVEKILQQEELQDDIFQFLRAAALEMLQKGLVEEGNQVVSLIVTAFESVPDEQLKEQVEGLGEEARFLELNLPKKMDSFANSEPNSLEELTEAARQLLEPADIGKTTLKFITAIGDRLERNQKTEAAKELYKQVKEAFQKTTDKELQQLSDMAINSAEKRLSLINQPLSLEGKLADGTELNWPEFQKDKAVLVIFWSVDNREYIEVELPKLVQLRDVYKARGFDVIGINVDRDKRMVERVLTFQPAPWPTLLDGIAGDTKMVEQCGVRMLPFTMLVARDGTVSSLHVTSQNLPEKLPALLGAASAGPAPPENAPSDNPPGKESEKTPPDNSLRGEDSHPRQIADDGRQFVAFKMPRGLDGEENVSDEKGATDEAAKKPNEEQNPYLAPAELSRAQLGEFLLKMEEKPKSIRARPGFDDALIDAANRILAIDEKDNLQAIAIETKFRTLHREAMNGVTAADEQIAGMLDTFKTDERPTIAAEVVFLSLEREVLNVDAIDLEKVPELLTRLKGYLEKNTLTQRHLRIASATIHAVNRLDVEQREEYFRQFGELFGTSKDRELAVYGRNIAQNPAEPGAEFVGKEINLTGVTTLGVEFDWSSYRGKVVLVDFWATWCGPCRREAPMIKVLHEKYRDQGFDVVGVNLDKDQDAISKYLDENDLPWANLIGDDTQRLAETYNVQGIPALFLIDREGKVVTVSHSSLFLVAKIEEMLAKSK